jgi:hypothetical protein
MPTAPETRAEADIAEHAFDERIVASPHAIIAALHPATTSARVAIETFTASLRAAGDTVILLTYRGRGGKQARLMKKHARRRLYERARRARIESQPSHYRKDRA